jgi:hypothetical protein
LDGVHFAGRRVGDRTSKFAEKTNSLSIVLPKFDVESGSVRVVTFSDLRIGPDIETLGS